MPDGTGAEEAPENLRRLRPEVLSTEIVALRLSRIASKYSEQHSKEVAVDSRLQAVFKEIQQFEVVKRFVLLTLVAESCGY